MLWIEGRSTAWSYLSEMELQPSIELVSNKEEKSRVITEPAKRATPSPTPSIPAADKPKRRSSPPDEIERKAEELRKQALSFTPQYSRFPEPQMSLEEGRTRVQPVLEEDTIDFIDHREEKKMPVVEIVSGVLVTALVAVCIIGGRSLFANESSTPVPRVAAKVVSTDEHAAKVQPVTSLMMVDNNQQIAAVDTVAKARKSRTKISNTDASLTDANINSVATAPAQPLTAETNKEAEIIQPAPVVKLPVDDATKKSEVTEKKEVDKQSPKEEKEVKPEEKKKGLFKKIFGKKKRDE